MSPGVSPRTVNSTRKGLSLTQLRETKSNHTPVTVWTPSDSLLKDESTKSKSTLLLVK